MDKNKIIEHGSELYFYNLDRDSGVMPDQSNHHYAGLGQCWGWKGSLVNGYGTLKVENRNVLAHRLSYMIHKGDIPNGMVVMHRCDNKVCTNPDHLELGTNVQNIKDAHARGLCKGKRGKKKRSFDTLMATLASRSEKAMKGFIDIFWEIHKSVDNADVVLDKIISDRRLLALQASIDEIFIHAVAEYNSSLIDDEIIDVLAKRKRVFLGRHRDRFLLEGDNEMILKSPRWVLDQADLPPYS